MIAYIKDNLYLSTDNKSLPIKANHLFSFEEDTVMELLIYYKSI